MTIEHIGIKVKNLKKSRAFYEAALAPLGLKIVQEGEDWAMIGDKAHSQFAFHEDRKPTPALHLAFRARSRNAVKKFYEAALDAGARDNGRPGKRPYSKDYYAAFVIDLNGHNLEAVTFSKK